MGVCKSINNTSQVVVRTPPQEVTKAEAVTKETSHNSNSKSKPKVIFSEKNIVINSNLFVGYTEGSPTQNYNLLKKLGEGSYGVVWKVKHLLTGHDRAMKRIFKHKATKRETEQEILNEISILKKVDHPNIVKIYEFYNTLEGYFIITEFCDKGELYQQIIEKAPFSESLSAHIMYQIFSAVNYCHNSNIIHRDLKPENILIEDIDSNGYYTIKIIDFGTAKLYEKNKSEKKIIGSSYYIAPEVLKRDYNEKCDLWSCGVIIYILLSGKAPFTGDKDNEILEKIKIGKYDLKCEPFDKISTDAKDLIKKLLEMDPKKRISASDALKHPWFSKLDIKRHFCEVDEELLLSTIDNLKHYNPDNKLQQAVMAYWVRNFSHIDEVKDIQKIFNKFDENSDGKLTREEMIKGLSKYLNTKNLRIIQKEVDEILSIMDADNNGYLDFEEFIRAGIDKELFLDDEILNFAFEYFDKDGSGQITLDELKVVFCVENDLEKTERLLKNMIAGMDEDQNGEVSFEEFKIMMERILIQS